MTVVKYLHNFVKRFVQISPGKNCFYKQSCIVTEWLWQICLHGVYITKFSSILIYLEICAWIKMLLAVQHTQCVCRQKYYGKSISCLQYITDNVRPPISSLLTIIFPYPTSSSPHCHVSFSFTIILKQFPEIISFFSVERKRLCVCVCVCGEKVEERERDGEKRNGT